MEINVIKQKPLKSINPSATAPAVPAERPKLTDEERAEGAKLLMSGMGWGSPAARPAAAASVAIPAAAPAAAPAMNSEEVIRRTASETARQTALAVAEVMRPSQPRSQAEPVPEFEMTPEDTEDYRVIQFMEGSGKWPEFKGKPALFLDYIKKHYAYQAQWLAANAGKEFDTDAPEHAEWYTANQPDIDPDDLAEGKIDMKVSEGVEEQYNRRIKPKEDAIAATEAFEQQLPVITENVTTNVFNFTKEVSPELAKLITNAEGEPSMSKENIDVLMSTDPIAGDIMDEIVRHELEPMLLELEKSAIRDKDDVAIFQLNPAKNRVHAAIDQFRQRTEREILDGPAENQVVDGKQFITVAKFQEMQRKAIASGTVTEQSEKLAEIDRSYWVINMDHVASSIVKACATKAKNLIEKADKRARSKYGVAEDQANPIQRQAPSPAPAPTAQPAPAPSFNNGKPNAPSFADQSGIVTTGKPGGAGEKTVGETVTKSLFGG